MIYSICIATLPTITAKILNNDLHKIPNLYQFLLHNAIVFLIILVVYVISIYTRQLLFTSIANKVASKMQMDLAEHLLHLKMKSFDEMLSGDITSRFCKDVNTARSIYDIAFPAILDSVVLITVLYTKLATINLYVCIVCFIYFPLMYLFGKLYLKKSNIYAKNSMKATDEMSGFLNESIKSMESIFAFGEEENLQQHFETYIAEIYKAEKHKSLISGVFSSNIVSRVKQLIDILFLIIFGTIYLTGSNMISIASLFIVIAYNDKVSRHFLKIFLSLSTIQNAFVAGSRICEVMKFEHEHSNGKEFSIKNGNVEFKM